jgi:2-oxoglutarate ferredoxin oxidoreductase subunit gamma
MTQKVLIAGFGGQGVMLMGELLSYAAMLEGKQVTYMPSYGPEMRGGTANCSVVVSEEPISSPIITKATILIAMNEPSMDKFEENVAPNGTLLINRSLIQRDPRRADISTFFVDCNALAQAIHNEKIANIVMLGAVVEATDIVSLDAVSEAMNRKFVGRKAKFIPTNLKALSAWKGDSRETC